MISFLNCFFFPLGQGWGGMGLRRSHRSLQCLSVSTSSLQLLIPLQKKLQCPLQLAAAWITDFYMVSSDSTDHEHQQGTQLKPEP